MSIEFVVDDKSEGWFYVMINISINVNIFND
jgi:hypothetical protein